MDKFTFKRKKGNIKVGICGKYINLEDSYASIVEALKHCSYNFGVEIEVVWIDTEKEFSNEIKNVDAIIVPGGFGSRGVEGKINAIKFARENNIPYLGICYGLQLAVVEFLRNVCGMNDAASIEFNDKIKNPVITLLDEQKKVVKMGGTMRLGSYEAKLKESKIKEVYTKIGLIKGDNVCERHRHRFEVNPEYISKFGDKGLEVVGYSKERNLVEFVELKDHKYFVATQAHPELKSTLDKPAPLFYGLIEAALKK